MIKNPTVKNFKKSFGKNLKLLRVNKNITQLELAKKSRMSQATIAAIECGKKSPSMDTLVKLSNGLSISIADLFYCYELQKTGEL